jgi:hypothetical protein
MAVDAYGLEVPARLEDVFDTRHALTRLQVSLGMSSGELADMHDLDGMQGVNLERVRQLLQAAANEIRLGMPYSKCECHARDDCSICGNKRWVTTKEYVTAQDMQVSTSQDGQPTNLKQSTSQ